MNSTHHPSCTLSVRVPLEMQEQLETLAEATGRSKSFLAAEALRNYLDVQAWQVRAIKNAIQKADNGEAKFLEHKQVAAWLNTWGTGYEVKHLKCK